MNCPEDRVIAFLAGELDDAGARDFDAHLLTCEPCWRAVQEDRQGRAAVLRLRSPAPSELADRVAMAVALAGADQHRDRAPLRPLPGRPGRGRPNGRTPRRRWAGPAGRRRAALPIASAVVAVAAVVAVLAWSGVARPGRAEPPQLAVVLAAARTMAPSQPAGPGPAVVAEHQRIDLHYYRVEDQPVLVATSTHDFPMPKDMHMAGSTSSDWMATQGKLGIYCVNAAAGRQSMLVIAAMPVEVLPRVAANLHLL